MAEPAVLEFRAMGSPGRVVVDANRDDIAHSACDLVHRLEAKWSRFLETSEINAVNRNRGNRSRGNHNPGRLTVVSEETYTLINHATTARQATAGVFNPLMLDQLKTHGYSRPWAEGTPTPTGEPASAATLEPIELYPEVNAVRLPAGCSFDPGGIGKGLAIDMAIELCLSKGATTACVELGGDLRVHGAPWYGSEWRVPVAHPFDPTADIATFTPTEGAVTTSTTLKRSWLADGRELHHLLDPATGYPSTTDIVSVTTCSTSAWWAEVAAKSALIVGSGHAGLLLAELGTPGSFVTADGRVEVYDGRTSAEEVRA